jgi:hypothetical protein
MINPTQLATLPIRALLFICICYGGFGLASARPLAAAVDATGTTAASPSSKSHATLAQTAALPQPAAKPPAPRGRAYLFRGALGPIFSRGMDRLTDRIEQAGITANVYEFTICAFIAKSAIREYREDPAPIILIGHSMGGLCALKFAEMLQDENIPASLVIAIDPAHASPSVPLNVERFINIFLSTNVLGGGDVKPLPGYQGHYASYDLSEHDEVTHINIDKMDTVHDQIVTKILQLSTTPAKDGSETTPLRYVVPPGTDIELWDSGMPLIARPGDTLQTLAASYHLPLWSLTQMNQGAENLIPGQRVIIPRHLVPPTEVSKQLPPKR